MTFIALSGLFSLLKLAQACTSSGKPEKVYIMFTDVEEENESVPCDCHWNVPVQKMLSSCCLGNSRDFEKTEVLAQAAEVLETVHNFSKYVLRPLYHPCNELGMCKTALDEAYEGFLIF